MKLNFSALIALFCLQSHAAIIQHQVVVDAPSVSVRAGEQQNGNLAIEQLFTNNTTSAQDSLSSSVIPFAGSPSFGGSRQRSAPAAFSTPVEVLRPSVIAPLPVTPPVIPAVPEPETYALMAIGLSGLLLARRKRTNRSNQ